MRATPMMGSSTSTERPAVVFIEELEDQRAATFLGRFGARFEPEWRVTAERIEGLTAAEAINWGRERAGLVLVRFGRRVELWSAGATPHWSYPRWPPPDLPPLVPRAVPPEDWRRVGGAGSELMWAVTIRLAPRDVFVDGDVNDDREAWDIAVASAAAARGMGWDRELLDGFIADAARAVVGDLSPGFATLWSPAYRVYALASALEAANAERMVAARFAPPEGFLVDYRARPADLSELAVEERPPPPAAPVPADNDAPEVSGQRACHMPPQRGDSGTSGWIPIMPSPARSTTSQNP